MEDQYQETLDAALTPSFRLFSRASVLWATFLGTPFPGGVLMALNYSRMGMNEEVARVLRWTGAFTACVIGLSIVWPASWNLPSALMVAPQLALMGWFYSANQKGKLQAHLDSGGRKASLVAATGVGLCSALIIVGGFLGADELLWMKHGKVLGLPLTDQVYYKDGATIEHARATAMVLRDQYWFTGFPGTQAQVRVQDDRTIVSILVGEEAWTDKEILEYFEEIGQELASSSLGPSVGLCLCYEPFQPEEALEFLEADFDRLENDD